MATTISTVGGAAAVNDGIAGLARLGLSDTQTATELLNACPSAQPALEWLRTAADPDAALAGVAAILNTGMVQSDSWSSEQWQRLTLLCGASTALADFLARHPQQVGAAFSDLTEPSRILDVPRTDRFLDDLRIAYRREVVRIAAVDLVAGAQSVDAVGEVAAALTVIADQVIASALAQAQAKHPRSADCRIAVIAMGKCGGGELNYVSDVDVMFVCEPAPGVPDDAALEVGTELAKAVMRACGSATAEGSIWEVDAALRPEGKAGALVRTLQSYRGYWERWAETWEFQALLKARYMAGDVELGDEFIEAANSFVWAASAKPGFVEGVQAMRRRVANSVGPLTGERELKLASGGLRDVEFAVQLLQLVHGRADEAVRSRNTLAALAQLSAAGYVGRDDADALSAAYRFLRTLEHRIQVHRMRRTHVLPDEPSELLRLARSLGFAGEPDLIAQWRRHASVVRRIHEKLFYRPLLQAVARLDSGATRLTPEAATSRLAALGYTDSAGALRHLEALTTGMSRRAAIQRTLLPVLLEWFADAVDPDAGLAGFRQVSDALGTTPWYLRLLRDESSTAARLAIVLGSSRYATDLLLRSPDSVQLLEKESLLAPRPRADLLTEAAATAARHDQPAETIAALRSMRRRELFRLACADILGLVDLETVGDALTDITDAVLAGAVAALQTPQTPPFGIIAMGRYGGAELSYSSDADVMFVYSDAGLDADLAGREAHRIAGELRRLLATPSPDPELALDADLRPEGKQGPLVRSLDSFRAYYARWSAGWESQALLRADWAVGDEQLGAQFAELIAPLRYPVGGLSDLNLREIRRLKARMEAERLPRGVDPALHTKLGRGGLSDVEWLVQVLQLRFAAEVVGLQTTKTLPALRAATQAKLIDEPDAQVLAEAWIMATRVRNGNMLLKGKASDVVPTSPQERSRLAQLLGYPAGHGTIFEDDYRRNTRRARAVFERLFFD